MSESQFFCPRLIDYLAIVGAHPNSSKRSSLYELQNNGSNNDEYSGVSSTVSSNDENFYIQNPELLRRYPAEDHKDFILPETMSYFCQPEGCVSFKHSRSESNKVTSFVFTLTDKDTTRTRYGVCVNFYRRVGQCYTNNSKNININDEQSAKKPQNNHSSVFLRCHSTTSFGKSMSQDHPTDQSNDKVTQNISSQPESQDLYSLTSLCLLSHHPLFSSFRTCLFYLKSLIDSCNKKINRSKKEGHKRKECIWSLLTGFLTQANSPRIIQFIKELEMWILRLLSTPVPVPGKTKLEVYLFSQNERQLPLAFALPDHTRFSLIDFPLHLPLELLGVDTCLYVLTIILLESKVVFQSKDYNALTMSVMALVALMYPLQYMFTVIPLLPTSLPKSEMLFESPVPYVVGVPSSFFLTKRDFRFPKDVWIVDLDSNKITPPIVVNREDAIPQLPKSESLTLKNNLKSALNGLSRININNKATSSFPENEVMSTTRPPMEFSSTGEDISKRKMENFQSRSNVINTDNRTNRGNEIRRQTSTNSAYNTVDIDSVDIAIRVAMVRFFLSSDVLANLTEHSRTLRLYPRPVVFFQINSFLKSRPNPSLFTCQLSRTQAVDYFAEWALTPNNVVFQRIQTGVNDPSMIGDKLKWFANTLEPVVFTVWQENCSIQNIMNVNVNSNRPSLALADGSRRSDSDGSDSSSSEDERPAIYREDFKVNVTSETILKIESQRLNIGPIVQGVHSAYEPPITLQFPMASDDSPDEDGTIESIGSKSIGSSPSSSHSDMSSPMFKPESIIDIVRCSQLQQSPSQLTATATGNKLLLSRHSTGGSDSALNHVVVAQKQNSNFRPTSQTSTSSEFYQTLPTTTEKKQNIISSPPSSRKGSLSSLHQQLTRQSSQNNSILEHFAFQAKELVRETARQSSQEGAGGILAHVADKLTTQAKKAAGEATKSVHEASKSAFEASKTAAGVSKNTFDDLTYVGKSTIGDLTKSAKQVASKKGFKVGLLGESSSSSLQQLSFDDEINDNSPPTNPISTGSVSEVRKSSVTSMGTGATKDFFSNISNDINGLANQTTSMFTDLFGGNKQQKNSKSSLTLPVTKTKERSAVGPFPTKAGRNDLVEKSSLIRHSNPRKLSETSKIPNKKLVKPNSHVDNETFLKDVTKQILDGDGIGWLKLSRFKKLMEEEGYRNLVVSKLNRTLDNKISPSDHIDDVYINRFVWKGMLKALLAIIHGLEVSFGNQCGGGLASAFQVLEIAHTHYWAKDISMTGFESQMSSPYSSRENVQSPLQSPSIAGSPMSSVYQTSRKSSQTSTSGLSECKNSGAGKFSHEFSLIDDGEESTSNPSLNETFNDLMNIENNKPEQISTNPFLENEGELSSIGPIVVSDESSCNSSTVLVNNPSFYLKRMTSNNSRNNASFFRSAVSDSELDNTGLFKTTNKNRTQSIWSSKSSLSAGFRYHGGNLLNTASGSPSPESGRTYLFEGILGKERSTIWNQLKFWEDVFIDAVSQERDMIGMDQGPVEMMERYKNLNQSERKRLEYDEDKLLSIMIYNLIAFMIMVNVPKESIMKIVRTLVGKSRVTNCYATEITSLMSQLSNLNGNDVDLKPSNSRQAHRQSFAVHCGDSTGELLFLEVRDDGLVLRSVSGVIVSRWWYERIVNMTYSPRSKIFCLWRTANGGQLQLNKYYTKKCKDLYARIKHSMEKAAERGQGIIPGVELGGEFPVKDMATGEGGILQVCMEGVGLLFADSKFFVRLDHVRKCFTVQKKIFVLEEYNPKLKHIIQRQYESPMAGQICYAVLCVFSYIAAGHKRTISQTYKDKTQRKLSTYSAESSENKC
ncbi:MAP kinase-activating death domain protein isoform X3 [Metopolophium dirhodum]|uniref:MAP kinase-activating death domain protein isoform X3 n=1 Tax=Metopolophium dirhodum TaxID=44670 RepID=UPI0029901540|nr:MAP kinase-activating death domain protein isoform X3 [Metopolophium dirhodum]